MAKKKYTNYSRGQEDLFHGEYEQSDKSPKEQVGLKGNGLKSTTTSRDNLESRTFNSNSIEEEQTKTRSADEPIDVVHTMSLDQVANVSSDIDNPNVKVGNSTIHHNHQEQQVDNSFGFGDFIRKGLEFGRDLMGYYATGYSKEADESQNNEVESSPKRISGTYLQEQKRFEHEQKECERRERKRLEKERKEKERQERERQERERRERERQERERIERERQEKEHQKNRSYETKIFELSNYIDIEKEFDDFFSLYSEKKEGLGEDAFPLIFKSEDVACVGVFDGMGGAGAAEYPTFTQGAKTGAYLASRVVRALCLDYIRDNKCLKDSDELKHYISDFLDKFIHFWQIRQTGLRSSLIRVLPTTLAIVEARFNGNRIKINSYWAGDSRNYLLTASGLKQISIDDLRHPQDPLENLRSDDALSNCICQDRPFKINKIGIQINEPAIILSATDGCFGYLPSPMHFEYILLNELMNSRSCDEWSKNVKKHLLPISSDDFTIGLQMLTGDIEYWKSILRERYFELRKDIIEPIENMKIAHQNAIEECKKCEENLYNGITNLWQIYKESYLLNPNN